MLAQPYLRLRVCSQGTGVAPASHRLHNNLRRRPASRLPWVLPACGNEKASGPVPLAYGSLRRRRRQRDRSVTFQLELAFAT